MAVLKYYDGSDWEPVVSALQGPTGPIGATGATGVAVGLPTGGVTGAVLAKTSTTDYDTEWDVLDYVGAWTSYTPTWTNITIGNGTNNFAYKQIGKTIFVRGSFTFGSTSSISGVPAFTLPVTSISYPSNSTFGHVYIEDNAVQAFHGFSLFASTTTANMRVLGANGTYVSSVDPSSTVPFTWSTNDFFRVNFTYQAA